MKKRQKQIHKNISTFFVVLFTLHFLLSGFTFVMLAEGEEGNESAPPQETTTLSESVPAGDAIISTGDAVSSGDLETSVNVNNIDTTPTENTETTPTPETAESVVEDIPPENTNNNEEQNQIETKIEENVGGPLQEIDSTITNENDAQIENAVTVDANSGGNAASGGNVIIDTGNAIAQAKLLNIANLNIVNAEGFFAFLDNLLGRIFDIDLRSYNFFSSGENENSPCTSACGGNGNLSISNEDSVSIENAVTVRANTGENTASSSGESIIQTGDAYAVVNVINVANTNIIDSNYLFLVFNNFGDWEGDLVFPGQELFLDLFGRRTTDGESNNTSSISINNENSGVIENNISVSGNTGSNSAEEGIIVTGDSVSQGGVSNVLNSNIFEDESFMVMLRVHGDWSGEVYGIPEGMNWSRIGDMVYLYSDGLGEPFSSQENNHSGGFSNQTTVSNTNNAVINNNVDVFAMTGGNQGGNGGIVSTGNAYAAANVMNVANTNIIGRNVLFALFNIFGNWNGNITFGRPDLWIGGRAYSPGPNPQPGNEIVYNFTITNNGDLESTKTFVTGYLHEGLTIGKLNYDYTIDQNRLMRINVGSIPPREHRTITLEAVLNGNALPFGKTTIIPMEFTARGTEKDENMFDNVEYLSFEVNRVGNVGGYGGPQPTPSPKLNIEKFALATSTIAGKTLDYRIIVTNVGGGPSYDSVLIDTLKSKDGKLVNQEMWDLETIASGEEVTIDYSVLFSTSTKKGFYTNFAEIKALGGFPSFTSGYVAKANTGSAVVYIEESPMVNFITEEEPVIVATSTVSEAGVGESLFNLREKGIAKKNTFLGIKNIKLPVIPFVNDNSGKVDDISGQGALALASGGGKTIPKSTFYTVALFASLLGALGRRGGKWMLL